MPTMPPAIVCGSFSPRLTVVMIGKRLAGMYRIAAAISHGSLVVRIDENPAVVQPEPFSRGQTALEPNSTITARQEENVVSRVGPGASLAEVVDALNALGASPADLVAILEGLKQAGSLTAELVII